MTKAMNEGLCKYARRQASDATKLRYHADLPKSIRTMLWCYWAAREWRVGEAMALPPAAGRTILHCALAHALEALKGRADALYVCADALVVSNRMRINTFALSAR